VDRWRRHRRRRRARAGRRHRAKASARRRARPRASIGRAGVLGPRRPATSIEAKARRDQCPARGSVTVELSNRSIMSRTATGSCRSSASRPRIHTAWRGEHPGRGPRRRAAVTSRRRRDGLSEPSTASRSPAGDSSSSHGAAPLRAGDLASTGLDRHRSEVRDPQWVIGAQSIESLRRPALPGGPSGLPLRTGVEQHKRATRRVARSTTRPTERRALGRERRSIATGASARPLGHRSPRAADDDREHELEARPADRVGYR